MVVFESSETSPVWGLEHLSGIKDNFIVSTHFWCQLGVTTEGQPVGRPTTLWSSLPLEVFSARCEHRRHARAKEALSRFG